MSNKPTQATGITPGRIITAIIVVLVIIFALLNSQSVKMHWIFTTTQTPLFVILILFAFFGLVAGYFIGRRARG
jgi:uncharacterized integral membrane protein